MTSSRRSCHERPVSRTSLPRHRCSLLCQFTEAVTARSSGTSIQQSLSLPLQEFSNPSL